MPKVVFASSIFILVLSSLSFLATTWTGNGGFLPFFILGTLIGMALLVPNKIYWQIAWALAAINFLLCLLLDSPLFGHSDDPGLFLLQVFQGGSILLALATVHFSVKFPYFDRRQRFFSTPAVRHSLMTPMTFPEYPQLFGQTMNLSETGCKTSFDIDAQIDFKAGDFVWFCFPEIGEALLQARIVAIEKPFIRFEFSPLKDDYRELLIAFLESSHASHKDLPEVTPEYPRQDTQ